MTKIADPHGQKRKQFITLVMKYVKPRAGSSREFLNKRTWNYPVTNLNNIIRGVRKFISFRETGITKPTSGFADAPA